MAWPERGPEVGRWLRLLQFLGIPTRGEQLDLPIRAVEQHRYRELATVHDLKRYRYVCLHPGARLSSRRWPPERFAKVGDWLAEQGFSVVLTGATAERDIAARVIASMRQPAISWARPI